jgi:hypothetical protein
MLICDEANPSAQAHFSPQAECGEWRALELIVYKFMNIRNKNEFSRQVHRSFDHLTGPFHQRIFFPAGTISCVLKKNSAQ